MALAQNLLDFASGYSFCDINRIFECQNRAELEWERRILAEHRLLLPKTGQHPLSRSSRCTRFLGSKKTVTHTVSWRLPNRPDNTGCGHSRSFDLQFDIGGGLSWPVGSHHKRRRADHRSVA